MWQPTLGFGGGSVTLALFAAANPTSKYTSEAWIAAVALAILAIAFGSVGTFAFVRTAVYQWGFNRTYEIKTAGIAFVGTLHKERTTVVVKRETFTGGLSLNFAQYREVNGYGGAPTPTFTASRNHVDLRYVDTKITETFPRFLRPGEEIAIEFEFTPVRPWSGYLVIHSQDNRGDRHEVRRGAARFEIHEP